MSWTSKLADAVLMCLVVVMTVMCLVVVFYVPSLLSAKIAVDRAKAKALSGLDLRDEETMRALRGLFGQKEEEE